MLLYPSVVVPATAITAGNLLCDSTTANAFAAPIVSGSPYDFGPYRDGRSYLELYASGVLVAKALISKSKSAGEVLDATVVTNGTFDSDVANWTPINSATLSNQAGGLSGNCMLLARNGIDYPKAGQSANVTSLALYRLTYSGKEKELNNVGFRVGSAGSPTWPVDIVNSSLLGLAGWTSKTVYFTSPVSTIYYAATTNATSGTDGAYFDSIAIQKFLTPAATAALLESAPGVRGWIYKSATAFENSALTMKIIQMKRYPNPRKINGVSTHHA